MQHPFSISPMPGALYLTPALTSALHKIQYVISNRQGMALLLGDAGTGKTSLMRRVYSDLSAQDDVAVAFIPQLQAKSVFAFVQIICGYYELPPRASLQKQAKEFEAFTFAQAKEGRNVVLLLDEAQQLTEEMLVTLRGFLNFESNAAKFLQIILAGQLELRTTIRDMKAIRRRIVMSSLLDSLTIRDLKAMLKHRCDLVGFPFPFDDAALAEIYDATGGIAGEALKLCAAACKLIEISGEPLASAELIRSLVAQEMAVFDEAE